jgi:hypothetical protein
VTESRKPHGFSIEAFGDLVGTGVWTLTQDGPDADVVYEWRVRADKPLLRLRLMVLQANLRGEPSLGHAAKKA